MSTLVLLLAGPLQSWGERSVYSQRDTLLHPTRSGIVGLLACAHGLKQDASLAWADDLLIHVRADRPGAYLTDFHMIGAGYPAGRGMVSADGTARKNKSAQPSGSITERGYLADAAFTVAVSSADTDLLDRLATALRTPKWPLFLGRKSCPPAHPVVLGVTNVDAMEVLGMLPAYVLQPRRPARVADTPSWEVIPSDVQSDFFDELEDLPTEEIAAPLDLFDQLADQCDTALTVNVTVYVDGASADEASVVLRDNPVTFQRDRRTYRSRNVAIVSTSVPAAGKWPELGVQAWATMRDAVTASTRSSDDTHPQ